MVLSSLSINSVFVMSRILFRSTTVDSLSQSMYFDHIQIHFQIFDRFILKVNLISYLQNLFIVIKKVFDGIFDKIFGGICYNIFIAIKKMLQLCYDYGKQIN
eukprot:61229_1